MSEAMIADAVRTPTEPAIKWAPVAEYERYRVLFG